MKEISVKDLIDFRRKSDRSKETFIQKLNYSAGGEIEPASGGDYWVRSLTALSRAFKEGDNSIIVERIKNILEDYQPNMSDKTKTMYDRNLQILYNYEDFDFGELKPTNEIVILEKLRKKGVLSMQGLPVKVLLHQLYSFENEEGNDSLGCVLFLAKLQPYQPTELGIFAEAVFNFLNANYAEKFTISPEDIRILDVMTGTKISYQNVLDGAVPSLLSSTLDEIVKLKNS